MAKKYVKKPIPVEAVQYTGKNFDEVQDFCVDAFIEDGWLHVHTLEGDMKAPSKAGDYVIKGIKGEFYICEKHVFEKAYEEAHDREYACTSSLF